MTPGRFIDRSFTNAAGPRTYKLYIPSPQDDRPKPLVVMLHGCTQSPEDFAAGTRMNRLADRHQLMVAYPAQAVAANGMKCWNWFDPKDQVRDRGEPSVIAGITQQIASDHAVDRQRIFAAGLSAGAAMAVILGVAYPELFAAVGAHSGLPYGAAHNVSSALSAMQGNSTMQSSTAPLPERLPTPLAATDTVPTIVFHGDWDATVDISNGSQIGEQAVLRAAATLGSLQKRVDPRMSARGRDFTVTRYRDSRIAAVVEFWVVHGAGHAWSGGSPRGSYTDVGGPDASVEMIRFFLSQTPDI